MSKDLLRVDAQRMLTGNGRGIAVPNHVMAISEETVEQPPRFFRSRRKETRWQTLGPIDEELWLLNRPRNLPFKA